MSESGAFSPQPANHDPVFRPPEIWKEAMAELKPPISEATNFAVAAVGFGAHAVTTLAGARAKGAFGGR